jgi:hypothetical protein
VIDFKCRLNYFNQNAQKEVDKRTEVVYNVPHRNKEDKRLKRDKDN